MLRTIWMWILQAIGFDPRGIFTFYDGRQYRRIDPMVAARRLWSITIPQKPMPGMDSPDAVIPDVPFSMQDLMKDIASGDVGRFDHACQTAGMVARQVFDLNLFDAGGLTELECVELLGRFDDYIGDVKKNSSGSPISAPSTGFPENSPTSSNSDSGSTSNDSNFEPPASSA